MSLLSRGQRGKPEEQAPGALGPHSAIPGLRPDSAGKAWAVRRPLWLQKVPHVREKHRLRGQGRCSDLQLGWDLGIMKFLN